MKYAKYTKSEIQWNSDYPAHWKCDKAKRFFSSPKEINRGNVEDNVLSLTLRGVIKNSKEKPIGLSPDDYSTYQIFRPNELVFKLIDLNNISTSRVGIVPETGIMSSAYIRFSPKCDMNIKYFYYQYFDWYKRNIFNGLGAGVRQTLSSGDLEMLSILIPPREEQDQIVRYLDWQVSKINKLIAAKRKEIEVLKEVKQKYIDQAFPIDCLQPFRHFITLIESGTSVNSVYGSVSDDGYGVLATSCVYGNIFHVEENKKVAPEDYSRVKCHVKENTLIVSRMNTPALVGACGLTDKEYTNIFLPDRLWQVHLNEKMLPEFAWRFLSTQKTQDWFASIATGSSNTMKNITKNQLKSVLIPCPPIERQQLIITQIRQHCAEVESLIGPITQEIQLLQEMKSKMISDVVTGQIDVRGVEIPEYEYTEEMIDDVIDDTDISPEVDEND